MRFTDRQSVHFDTDDLRLIHTVSANGIMCICKGLVLSDFDGARMDSGSVFLVYDHIDFLSGSGAQVLSPNIRLYQTYSWEQWKLAILSILG